MTSQSRISDSNPASPRALPLLLLFFFGSGCAALIYEIVWFQMLSLIIGSSAVSIGVLLGTFMGGMCLGSLFLPRFVGTKYHPLRVYAALEGLIGIMGILVYFGLPYAGGLYVAISHGMPGIFLRGVFAGLCLLPPTILMGATLPAISRWVKVNPRGISWLGFFYGGNTVGAVVGCILAGFYLLRLHDVQTATTVAVVLNFVVAAAAFTLAKSADYSPAPEEPLPRLFAIEAGSWPIYVTIALSGMSALGFEVVSTRLLSLLLGQTVYTFSLILAVFLVGIALGSSGGSMMAKSAKNARVALGWCQFLLMLAIAWAAWSMTQALPYWPINPSLVTGVWFQFQLDIARCVWVVLPGAILWGASFPLALAATAGPDRDPGRLVSTVYAANTIGGIIGSAVAAIILIPKLGTQHSQQILIGLAAIGALLTLAMAVGEGGSLVVRGRNAALAVLTVGVAFWTGSTVIPVPALLIGYGHNAANRFYDHGQFIFWGEGMNSSMAVSEVAGGIRNYHNAGKVQASSEPQDMRLQRMLGHLTTLLPAKADNVLVIACGAGVTAGAVSIDPAVKHETIAEIEEMVPRVVAELFSGPNFDVVKNPKVQIQIDDARHFLLSTKEKFDAITSDPFDPWVKGAATLYTREFWQLAKDHLNSGGTVTVFVQLYESTEAAVKSEVATFLSVFPKGAVFSNTYNGAGYDVVMVGKAEDLVIDVDAIDRKLALPEYAPVKQSLSEIGFNSAVELLGTFAGRAPEFKAWLSDAEINYDRNLRLQYLAGMGANLYIQDSIHRNMVKARQYPEGMFVGDEAKLLELRARITTGIW